LPIRVVDENDKSLPGAVVEPQGNYAQRRQAIRTDSHGRGVLRNLSAGVVRVYASYGSLVLQSKIVVDEKLNDGEETLLQLRELNPQSAQAKPIPDPPPVGAAAPEWSIIGWTDGQTRTLSDHRGKVVVLDFWGIWCSACLNGLPAIKELEHKYAGRDDVVFLGIHSAGTEMSQIKKLQRLKDWKLVTGLDQGSDIADGAMARAYGAHGWPTTVIIDREGKIAYNSNLEKWNQATVVEEMARVAKALNLPAEKPGASIEDEIVRMNTSNVFRMSEFIDRALEQK
jgi:thiol-disulfide isomerase/thioredoxin